MFVNKRKPSKELERELQALEKQLEDLIDEKKQLGLRLEVVEKEMRSLIGGVGSFHRTSSGKIDTARYQWELALLFEGDMDKPDPIWVTNNEPKGLNYGILKVTKVTKNRIYLHYWQADGQPTEVFFSRSDESRQGGTGILWGVGTAVLDIPATLMVWEEYLHRQKELLKKSKKNPDRT
jgi:hypothetical protein